MVLLYLTLHYTTLSVLHSTWLYITLPFLYSTLLDSTYTTLSVLHSTWHYITIPWLYSTLLDSTLHDSGSTPLYLTLHYSTVAILHSTWLYKTLPWLYSPLYWNLHYSIVSVVVHRSGVQRDRNLWSCDDRKGYSPEDQQFLSIFPNETAAYFVITAPPI